MLSRLDEATCNFCAVALLRRELENAGFSRLNPAEEWNLRPGDKRFIIKNDSAIFAFTVGTDTLSAGFRIISAHSDSPCFKIKPNPEIIGDGGLVSLNVEKYGGGILSTWFDRPLSISGRVITAGPDPLHPVTHIVDLRRPVATIPNLAIHFNRAVNDGVALSVQKDMKPVVGYFSEDKLAFYREHGGLVRCFVAEHLGIAPEDIISSELCLYPAQKAQLTGVDAQMLQSARIDDLSMAFCALEAMLATCDAPAPYTRVMAIFDNEETGSGTKQGAASPVLANTLRRVAGDETAFLRALDSSFMISADDAHAWHPNYNEKYDPTNHPVPGGGPVVKINANCKYMTDAVGDAVFRRLCHEAGVECQYFVNHADVAGGSTLGNILTSQMDIPGVDMGCAIWAMHSACETASASDHEDTARVFTCFWK